MTREDLAREYLVLAALEALPDDFPGAGAGDDHPGPSDLDIFFM